MKTMTGGRAQSIGRRGKVEQVSSQHLPWGGRRVASALVEVGSPADRVKPLMEMTRYPEQGALAPSPFHPKLGSDSPTLRNTLMCSFFPNRFLSHVFSLGSSLALAEVLILMQVTPSLQLQVRNGFIEEVLGAGKLQEPVSLGWVNGAEGRH